MRRFDLLTPIFGPCLTFYQPAIAKLAEQAHAAMALYRGGQWPPKENDAEKACGGRYKDMDVMRFVGRPGFVALQDHKDVASTPDTTSSGSPPNTAHPLLFEYLKRFQTDTDSDGSLSNGPPSAIGFPPEQSMLPPIMSGLDGMTLHDPFTFDTSTMPETNGHATGFPYTPTFDPLLAPASSNNMDWAGLLSSHGLGYTPETFNPNTLSFPYVQDEATAFSMSHFEPTGQVPDQVWQNFLTGLLPQENPAVVAAAELDFLK
jgi:hypothetical protein